MPYKVVETFEKGKSTLVVIPSNWEQNNVLHWPKWKVETLMAAEDSYPDASWITMKCRVKRTGLVSKESAEEELAVMCAKSDTEAEESVNENSKIQQSVNNSNANNAIQEYFNDISKSCANKECDKTLEEPGPSQTKAMCNYLENNTNDNLFPVEHPQPSCGEILDSTPVIFVQAQVADTVSVTTSDIEQSCKITSSSFVTLSQNQAVILDYMKRMEEKILKKLSTLSAEVEKLVTCKSKSDGKADNVTFKPLSNKEELQIFEKSLENKDFQAETKELLLSVCGKGKGRGLNNAYTLSDIMFTRQFLTECSWTGGSKNKIDKICFKFYSKTIDLFFEIVQASDKEFTKMECETFFKNIMRHAATRNKPEIKRAASSKRRGQKLVTVTNNSTSNSLIINDTNDESAKNMSDNQPTSQPNN